MILLLDFFARKCECKTITSAISCALFGYIFISVTLIFLIFCNIIADDYEANKKYRENDEEILSAEK